MTLPERFAEKFGHAFRPWVRMERSSFQRRHEEAVDWLSGSGQLAQSWETSRMRAVTLAARADEVNPNAGMRQGSTKTRIRRNTGDWPYLIVQHRYDTGVWRERRIKLKMAALRFLDAEAKAAPMVAPVRFETTSVMDGTRT